MKKSNFVGVEYKQQLTMYCCLEALNICMVFHPDMHLQTKCIFAQNNNMCDL